MCAGTEVTKELSPTSSEHMRGARGQMGRPLSLSCRGGDEPGLAGCGWRDTALDQLLCSSSQCHVHGHSHLEKQVRAECVGSWEGRVYTGRSRCRPGRERVCTQLASGSVPEGPAWKLTGGPLQTHGFRWLASEGARLVSGTRWKEACVSRGARVLEEFK